MIKNIIKLYKDSQMVAKCSVCKEKKLLTHTMQTVARGLVWYKNICSECAFVENV